MTAIRHPGSLLKELDLDKAQFLALVTRAAELKRAKAEGAERLGLTGRNIALIFEKSSTRTRCCSTSPPTTRERAPPTSARRARTSDARNPSPTPPACSAGCSTASSSRTPDMGSWRTGHGWTIATDGGQWRRRGRTGRSGPGCGSHGKERNTIMSADQGHGGRVLRIR